MRLWHRFQHRGCFTVGVRQRQSVTASRESFVTGLRARRCICATGVVTYFLLQSPLEPTSLARRQTASL